ncbi:hypothetical protein SUGI_0895080 [Cryptomeria japonica]|nr:hypothetical protein SUGI_0895080 [Cryptomeria japonica]
MRNITATPHSLSSSSIWHSPVPYLFGGVAAMVALIAFAFIILACSYFSKPNGAASQDSSNRRSDSNFDQKSDVLKDLSYLSENDNGDKVVVIMAGEEMPSFIAKPTPVAFATK